MRGFKGARVHALKGARVPALIVALASTYVGAHAWLPQAKPAPGAEARTRLAAIVEPVIDAVWKGYDQNAAMDHVRFMSQYWRLAGNTGYNSTIDRIQKRLSAAGISTSIDEYPNNNPAWDHSVGTLALVTDGKPDQVVLSREQDRLALCINSFSTAPEGVVAPLIDVGRGTDQDFAGKNVKGAVVLGDADIGGLFRRAVVTGGALGVISTTLPQYLNADAPGAPATPREEWGILQWGSVPYDEARKAFGFKASPKAATTLRRRLAAAAGASVSVRVTIASTFTPGPVRTLVAEIPGRSAAAERIVMAAHIQEPGANDNASGAGTLAETAVALAAAIRSKAVAQPERTLTFLFLNEISGSRRWIQDHPAEAKQTRYMFSLDMTGEDVAKTGGSFLIERYPDPGAVYTRPWDPHSEWGAGNVRADSLKGDLINDAHHFVVQQVARRSNWVVKTNPYEGGSDHTEFQRSGVPSVLDWHFTDRYYHTNFDTPDKTSPAEMRNVGVSVAASAWLLASASPSIATDVARIVADAGRARIAQEQTEGAKLAAAAPNSADARARETTILVAWKKWYAEAVRSASRLVVGTPAPSFSVELNKIAAEFETVSHGVSASLPGLLASTAWLGFTPFAAPIGLQSPEAIGIFTCGVDQVVPPITVNWVSMVLIGDGRIYVPCPRKPDSADPIHPPNHRENREQTALNLGQNSNNPEVRWRAAQAVVRTRGVAFLMRGTTPAPSAGPLATYYAEGIDVDSILGEMQDRKKMASKPLWVPVCRGEVQYFGSFAQLRRWQAGPLFQYLIDDNPEIRKEAAYSVGMRMGAENLEADMVNAAVNELRACWLKQSDVAVQSVFLATLGVIRYTNEEQRKGIEDFLVKESQGSSTKVLGAVQGLEALIRRNPQPGPSEATRERLRQLVTFGKRTADPPLLDPDSRIRRLALSALMTARDTNMLTFRRAIEDDDWQMRRLIASRINILNDDHAEIAEVLAVDPEFQVRYDFLSAISRWTATTKICEPLVDRFKDPSPHVVMRAMDLVTPACTDIEDTVDALLEHADKLEKPEELLNWHIPSRALTALARLNADEAKPRLATAIKHPAWQVRAAVAAAAVTVQDEALAVSLMEDVEPNVRTAALEALMRMKSAAVFPHAIMTLRTGRDYQLLRTAASVLRGLPVESREDASSALLFTLNKLTEEGTDTSRDPRVAIIERLGEILAPERSSDLLPYVSDYDDEVIAAATKAFSTLVGTLPADAAKRRRYPYQPKTDQISRLPKEAVIQLESGFVTLQFMTDVAPVSVARFAELAVSGFYNDRTFHRIVPNFVVQGGSPGANEYAGTSRYMRDEVGPQASHVRGAVGISSRGMDTGDAQIFIDLVDLPRLDRDYTVFAYVVKGMELIDQMLDGAKIVSVTVR